MMELSVQSVQSWAQRETCLNLMENWVPFLFRRQATINCSQLAMRKKKIVVEMDTDVTGLQIGLSIDT